VFQPFIAQHLVGRAAEDAAAHILASLRVRYVVAQPGADFLGEPPDAGSMLASLFESDGSERRIETAAAGMRELPGLSRHRLLFDARPLAGTDRSGAPTFKVFEFVPGARLTGAARPGARVRAELRVRSNRGREFVYRVSTRASADGRYELVVPYATAGGPPGIRVDARYALSCGSERAYVGVPERAVRESERLEAPPLCLGPSPGP